MTSLLRVMAVCATLVALSTPAYAQGPSTTIVNNGNNNINIVLNIQAPRINIGMPGLPPMPHSGGCMHQPPGLMAPPSFLPPPPPINQIVNFGHGNVNQISNRGGFGGGGAQNTIVNLGNGNVNQIRNRFR